MGFHGTGYACTECGSPDCEGKDPEIRVFESCTCPADLFGPDPKDWFWCSCERLIYQTNGHDDAGRARDCDVEQVARLHPGAILVYF